MRTYTLVGLTDDVTNCGCCNRANLKKTVVLSLLDGDGNHEDYHFFGTSCAAKALGWTDRKYKSNAEINRLAKSAISDAVNAEIWRIKQGDEFQLIKGYFCLRSVVKAWIDNEIEDLNKESQRLAVEQYPILGYCYASLSLEDAARLLFHA